MVIANSSLPVENLIRPLGEPVPAEDDDGVWEDGPGGAEGDRVHGAKRQLDLPQFPSWEERRNGAKKF